MIVRLLRHVTSDATMTRVIEPIVADADHERAPVRGLGALASALLACSGYALLDGARRLPRVALAAALTCGAISLGLVGPAFAARQALWLLVGAVVMLLVAALTPARRASGLAAVIGVAIMVATLVLGEPVAGATRWIVVGAPVQPAELCKPLFLASVAAAMVRGRSFVALGIASAFVVAIALQPDRGLAVVYLAMLAAMGAAARRPGIAAVAVVGSVAAWLLVPSAAGVDAPHTDAVLLEAARRIGPLAPAVITTTVAVLVGALALDARRAQSSTSTLLVGFGAAAGIAAQAWVHGASTLLWIEPVNVALPIISYGGSAIVGVLATLGLLARSPAPDGASDARPSAAA
jgi:cell division protein FtsW (lipid II flippase)